MLLAEKYYRRLNSRIDMAFAHSGLAEIYALSGKPGEALLNYKTALQLATETSEKNLQQSVLAGFISSISSSSS